MKAFGNVSNEQEDISIVAQFLRNEFEYLSFKKRLV